MNIETHESRSAGGVWATSQQDCPDATQFSAATAATTETAHSSATSMTGGTNGTASAKMATSRDEHTKQRLAMLVATLQNSAR